MSELSQLRAKAQDAMNAYVQALQQQNPGMVLDSVELAIQREMSSRQAYVMIGDIRFRYPMGHR